MLIDYHNNYDEFVQKLHESINRHMPCEMKIWDNIVSFPCKYFTVSVDKEDWHSEFAKMEYGIDINANVSIDLFSKTVDVKTIEKGLGMLFKVINECLKITDGDVYLVERDCYDIIFKRTVEGLWGENHKDYQ